MTDTLMWAPEWAANLIDEKPLPYRAIATGDGLTTSFLGKNYGVATVTQTRRIQFLAHDLPNVPLASDLATTDRGRRAIEFFAADTVLAWPLVAPPDVPAEGVAEIRTAFKAMMQDTQLLAEAASQCLDIDPVGGSEIAELVQRLYDTPPDVLDLVRTINSSR